MSAANPERARQLIEFHAEELAMLIDEMDRRQTGESGPLKTLRDYPPHAQQIIYEMAARELANVGRTA